MIIRLRKDLLSLGGGMKRPKKVVEQPVTVGTLLMLLPSRDEVEPMVHLYIDAFEATYRILHVPSFWTEYSRFWEAPHDAREGFVVTLLAVLAIVACAVKRDQYSFKGSDSVWRDKVLGWVAAADFWVQNHSHKHLTITFFQIHCLVLLAKRSNHIKKKRAWIYAQAVFNLAMSAGMHREPSYLGTRTSIFEKEMRRRLWATICELELHASVERGMIPSSGHAVSDTLPPLNIDDENFNENSDKLPHPKPAPISTRTLYLSESCKTQQLRISLTTLINNPKRRLMEQEAFAYEEDVTQCIEDLANTTGEESFPSLARSMLDLQLRQYLLLLRRPLALKASTRHIQNYSRLVCLNTATRIINEHSRFMKQGSYTLRHLRDDMFGASLNICLDLLYNDPKSGITGPIFLDKCGLS